MNTRVENPYESPLTDAGIEQCRRRLTEYACFWAGIAAAGLLFVICAQLWSEFRQSSFGAGLTPIEQLAHFFFGWSPTGF